jgi:hypothetical protein
MVLRGLQGCNLEDDATLEMVERSLKTGGLNEGRCDDCARISLAGTLNS